MLIVYIVVAVLAVAVCVLFAMVGELATRVLRPSELHPSVEPSEPKTIDEINVDADVSMVPAPVGSLPDAMMDAPLDFGLVVLTTVCTSCHAFAREISRSSKVDKLPRPLFLLVSAPNSAEAERFVTTTGLAKVPDLDVLFDRGGHWCHRNLGLNRAPSFVRVADGRVRHASTVSSFTDIPVMWEPVQAN